MKIPHIYQPDEARDCGFLGEHYITFTAWIEHDYINGREYRSVEIKQVTMALKIGTAPTREIDVTELITGKEYTRRPWEDEIFEDYRRCQERNCDEVVA